MGDRRHHLGAKKLLQEQRWVAWGASRVVIFPELLCSSPSKAVQLWTSLVFVSITLRSVWQGETAVARVLCTARACSAESQ